MFDLSETCRPAFLRPRLQHFVVHGPFKGPRGPLKEPRGPSKGPRSPLRGPRGPLKGARSPLRGPWGPYSLPVAVELFSRTDFWCSGSCVSNRATWRGAGSTISLTLKPRHETRDSRFEIRIRVRFRTRDSDSSFGVEVGVRVSGFDFGVRNRLRIRIPAFWGWGVSIMSPGGPPGAVPHPIPRTPVGPVNRTPGGPFSRTPGGPSGPPGSDPGPRDLLGDPF